MKRKIPKVPTSELEKLNEGIDDDRVNYTPTLFEKLLRETPLYTRLKVYLEMEYLNATLQENECCEDEDMRRASEWSKKVSTHIIGTLKEWENDGRPGEIPDKNKVEIG